jgi:hypothetical protein
MPSDVLVTISSVIDWGGIYESAGDVIIAIMILIRRL